MQKVLLTFVGFHDPFHKSALEGEELKGPVLYLLGLRRFDRVYLFTGPSTLSIAKATAEAIGRIHPETEARVEPVDLDLAVLGADAAAVWADRAARSGVRFVDEVVRTPLPVRTDPVRVRQIAVNHNSPARRFDFPQQFQRGWPRSFAARVGIVDQR